MEGKRKLSPLNNNNNKIVYNPKDKDRMVVSIGRKFGKLSSGHRTGKGQFSFQSLRKTMPKNAQTPAQLHSSHTLAK